MKKIYLILTMCLATTTLAQNSFPTSNAIGNEIWYTAWEYVSNKFDSNKLWQIGKFAIKLPSFVIFFIVIVFSFAP